MTLGPQGLNHPDYLKLIQSMPRTSDGMVKAIQYVPKGQQEAYIQAWRDWCREHPDKTKWPKWLHDWIAVRKRENP